MRERAFVASLTVTVSNLMIRCVDRGWDYTSIEYPIIIDPSLSGNLYEWTFLHTLPVTEDVMELGISDRTALVAASSRGIGKGCAMELAKEGVDLVLCARGEEDLEETAHEIEHTTQSEVFPLSVDLNTRQGINQLINHIEETVDHVDIAVTNNGGPPPGTFEELSDQEWEEAVEGTLMSSLRIARGVLPGMKEQGWGRIVNITSISVKEPIENLMLSNSVRSAVVGWAKTLSKEVGEEGILVNNVCPGYVHTSRVEQLARENTEGTDQTVEEFIQGLGDKNPIGRPGTPEEIGALVAFLCSEKASYINGTTIQADGGQVSSLL